MICKKCNIDKDSNEFAKDSTRKSGRHPYCRQCQKLAAQQRMTPERREQARLRASTWYALNQERARARDAEPAAQARRQANMAIWRRENREHVRAYAKHYEKTRCAQDPTYRLAVNLRKRLGSAIRGNQKTGSAVADLGCSVAEFKQYLERLFKPGMNWDNWNRTGWHIDHIQPLASFDLSDPVQLRRAVHYTNLQPLWASENCIKGAKLPSVPTTSPTPPPSDAAASSSRSR